MLWQLCRANLVHVRHGHLLAKEGKFCPRCIGASLKVKSIILKLESELRSCIIYFSSSKINLIRHPDEDGPNEYFDPNFEV